MQYNAPRPNAWQSDKAETHELAHQMALLGSVMFGGAMGYRAGANPYVSAALRPAPLRSNPCPPSWGSTAPIPSAGSPARGTAVAGDMQARRNLATASAMGTPATNLLSCGFFALQVGPGGAMLAALGGLSSAYHLTKWVGGAEGASTDWFAEFMGG